MSACMASSSSPRTRRALRSSISRSTRGRTSGNAAFASSGVKSCIFAIVPTDVKRCLVILSLLAVALAATACGERSEPLGELEQSYPVTVQGAGAEPAVLSGRPERIVALDPGAARSEEHTSEL